MDVPVLLLSTGGHQLEAAETLVQAGRFAVILFAARAMAELMVRLRLPAILGELVAGVLIGVSGLPLILAPELVGDLNSFAQGAIASLAQVGPDQVQEIYDHSFSNLQAVGKIGLLALLFLTGLESELDELMAVGMQAGLIQSVSQSLWPEPPAWGLLGGIAPSLCPKPPLPQLILI